MILLCYTITDSVGETIHLKIQSTREPTACLLVFNFHHDNVGVVPTCIIFAGDDSEIRETTIRSLVKSQADNFKRSESLLVAYLKAWNGAGQCQDRCWKEKHKCDFVKTRK